MFNFFEHPWGLLAAAVVVWIVLCVIGAVLPDKKRRWHLAIPVIIAIAAFGVDFLVNTDLEKIKAVIKTISKSVETENPDQISPLIAEDYRDSYHRSRQSFMIHCRAVLVTPLVNKNIARVVTTEISSPSATAVFTVNTLFDKQGPVAEFRPIMFSKVEINLQKQPDGRWQISRAEIIEIDKQPVKWSQIRRF